MMIEWMKVEDVDDLLKDNDFREGLAAIVFDAMVKASAATIGAQCALSYVPYGNSTMNKVARLAAEKIIAQVQADMVNHVHTTTNPEAHT